MLRLRLAAVLAALAFAGSLQAQCCQPPPPNATPAPAQPSGLFIRMGKEHMVRNVGGNCCYASIEMMGRYQGIEALHGFSRGKHGATSSSMAAALRRVGVEFEMATNREAGLALMDRYLTEGKPVLFSIPGHCLICCGKTIDTAGKEWVWVVDNTGREGCETWGWPREEFRRRYDGWVTGLRPIFPLRPRPDEPAPAKPGPHIQPSPTTVPTSFPTAEPKKDRLHDLETRLAKLEEATAKLPEETESKVESRLAKLREATERAVTIATKAADALPQLKAGIDTAEKMGLLSSEKADKLSGILEKFSVVVPKVAEVTNELQSVRASGDTSRGMVYGAGGIGLLGILGSVFAFFRRQRPGSAPSPAAPTVGLPGNPVLNTVANLPHIPGTSIDDALRMLGQLGLALAPFVATLRQPPPTAQTPTA